METTLLPDASGQLIYRPSLMAADSVDGLWLCTDADDAAVIGVNAAAPAMGTGPAELARCRAFLEAFNCVVLVGADPERRRALGEQLREALPSLEICDTEQEAYRDCASVGELRDKHGLGAVEALGQQAYELEPWGILPAWEVGEQNMAERGHLSTGIPQLDSMIGGFYDGELTVWTGRRGEGKSTALMLPVLSALQAGERVFLYSGELPAERFMGWFRAMAVGPEQLESAVTDTGKEIWRPRREAAERINRWLRGRLFLADNDAANVHTAQRLLDVFAYARKRYGCRVFVADNLMTVELSGEDLYRAQSRFVGSLVEFAHREEVHVHLVAHPRKSSGKGGRGGGGSDEVSGSGDITNRADNVLRMSREAPGGVFQGKLEVLKNRDFGETGEIGLRFEPRSRRFYQGDPNWQVG